MTIKIDTTKLENNEGDPGLPVFPAPECQFGEPKIAVEGVSFPNTPTFIGVMPTNSIVSGTITVVSEPADPIIPLDVKAARKIPARHAAFELPQLPGGDC